MKPGRCTTIIKVCLLAMGMSKCRRRAFDGTTACGAASTSMCFKGQLLCVTHAEVHVCQQAQPVGVAGEVRR